MILAIQERPWLLESPICRSCLHGQPLIRRAAHCSRYQSQRLTSCRTGDGVCAAGLQDSFTRRCALLLATSCFAWQPAGAAEEGAASQFSNPRQRYKFQPPSGWAQTQKAGADVLFEDPQQKGTNLGVTVTPVSIASLEKFGSVASVGEKLLTAERNKESTKTVTMIRQDKRTGISGTTMYDFDYILDSTRGTKRILSTVAISNQRLFIVNGNIKCSQPGCEGTDAAVESMQQSLASFVDT